MQRRQVIRRVAIAAALVVLAMVVSYVIRDWLALNNPVSALPIMHVQYYDEETEIPPDNCLLASYSWRFVGRTVEWAMEDPNAWRELEPFPTLPGAPLSVSFSFPASNIRVSRWYSDREVDAEVLSGGLYTPYTGGAYVYRIEADWEGRGSVQYYFKVRVS